MNDFKPIEKTALFDKIYASMLGGAIGDAMGGPVEGGHYERIGERYGTSAIPPEWRATLEAANPEPDMRALSLGLAQVAQQRQQKMQAVTAAVDGLLLY